MALAVQADVIRQQVLVAQRRVDPAPESGGFTIRKGDPALASNLTAFEEAVGKMAWEKAFTELAKVMDSPPDSMVRRSDGFYLTMRTHVRNMLLTLPATGRDAYRLFNDVTARQALEQLDSPSETMTTAGQIDRLQTLFDRYFVTSVGDQIADRLGDTKFESGDFAGAANAWGAILSDYPDTSLSAARIATKRVIALARGGRWDELQIAQARLLEKYGDQSVRFGGRDMAIAAVVEGLPRYPITSALGTKSEPAAASRMIALPKEGSGPGWQMQFLDSTLQAQIKTLSASSQVNFIGYDPATIVPAAEAADNRVYLNWLGTGLAIDAVTGKLLWRSEPFNTIATRIQLMVLNGYDSGETSIAISPAHDKLLLVNGSSATRIVSVGQAPVALRAANLFVPAGAAQPQVMRMAVRPGTGVMTCLAAADGRRQWSSDTAADLSSYSIIGKPLIVDDTAYVVAVPVNYQGNEASLLAVSLANGDLRWKMTLGAIAGRANFRGIPVPPKPLLLRSGETLYVLTGNGALLAVNLPDRRVEWAFAYETISHSINGIVGGTSLISETQQFPSSMQLSGSVLYVKERGNNMLYGIDVSEPRLKWQRRVDADTSIAAVDDSAVYVLGDELNAIDLKTREMLRSTATPLGLRGFQPLVEGSRAYLFGSRGIYGVDLQLGKRETFTSGESGGGALLRSGDQLICVSNRNVTAYKLPASETRQP